MKTVACLLQVLTRIIFWCFSIDFLTNFLLIISTKIFETFDNLCISRFNLFKETVCMIPSWNLNKKSIYFSFFDEKSFEWETFPSKFDDWTIIANRSVSLLIVDRHPLHVDRSDFAYSARNPHSSDSILSNFDLRFENMWYYIWWCNYMNRENVRSSLDNDNSRNIEPIRWFSVQSIRFLFLYIKIKLNFFSLIKLQIFENRFKVFNTRLCTTPSFET